MRVGIKPGGALVYSGSKWGSSSLTRAGVTGIYRTLVFFPKITSVEPKKKNFTKNQLLWRKRLGLS